jgi:antiviral helicase SLH1
MICTTQDKLAHYLQAVTSQVPIESRFSKHMVDNLNAEIALGTVTSVPEAVQWLGYSYLYIRMLRNPLTYGIDWAEIRDDPKLVSKSVILAQSRASLFYVGLNCKAAATLNAHLIKNILY